jgi:hypothetical protein
MGCRPWLKEMAKYNAYLNWLISTINKTNMKCIIIAFLMMSWVTPQKDIYNTKHFKIFFTGIDANHVQAIADSLEGSYTRIITDLQSQGMRTVTVHLYSDTQNYREGVKPWAPNLPFWSTGSTLGDSAIHMISPDAPGQDYKEMIKSIIHEFAHCVSRHINPKIANNPRWLWEAIAIYESGQAFDPHNMPYLVSQKPPTLTQLNDWQDTAIYDVGYFIAQYLVESKGNAILNTLIKNNGDIKQTLDMDDEEFTKQWFKLVKKKYGM